MIAWYVVELVRYGKLAVGESRWNSTVGLSIFLIPPGERTPLKAESACEPGVRIDEAVERRDDVVRCRRPGPFWNFTFGRSLNVHTVAFAFGVQLVASSGIRVRLCVAR